MIHIENLSKVYPIRQGVRTVLDKINLTIDRGQKIGILGRNGSGKSTLIRLISGAEHPSSGKIHRGMSISWPLALGDAFQGNQTGLDCLRFICRIYGIKKELMNDKIEFVNDFAELGTYFHEPIKSYSSGMRARLSFAISMAVEFDCFLIDEVIAVGDDRFHKKCYEELFEKRKDRALVIVSHDPTYIQTHCESAAVLSKGRLYSFDKINDAYDFYQSTRINAPTREHVIASYRFILGREPENEFTIQYQLSACDTVEKLRKCLFSSEEFKNQLYHDKFNVFSDTLRTIPPQEEDITLAYNLILARDPEPDELNKIKKSSGSFERLRSRLLESKEFQLKFKRLLF
ncbi:ABC transporter ATP-binding protein [Fluoribacter gormanii]|uniref:ABC transporter ATP-binding protein n=1 Tax=Fluoribacter gormanii TaxID=464 RepID=UPI0022440502|nr:ABC transporter ATP-binding protein [Fluoribacter gormanii]MCW8445465.1 ABC transporter ATP-binding protein [Fluoribacter gormanii]